MSFYNDASLVFLPSGGAGKDGKAYSMKPVPEYGSELVTNGGFDTDSDWNLTSGGTDANISNGKANFVNAVKGQRIQQNFSFTAAKTYKVVFTVSNYTSGLLGFYMGGVYAVSNINANGTYTYLVTPTNNAEAFLRAMQTGVSHNFSVDDISVREVVVGDGDFTFSRGSNLTATRVDSNGLIEKGRENLLTQSNNFSDSDWTKATGNIVTGGQSGYDGSTDAWEIESPSNNYIFRRTNTQGGVQTLSIYVKKNTSYGIRLYAFGTDNANVYYDLNTGVVVARDSDVIDDSITDVGNDWWRITMTYNQTNTQLYFYVTDNSNTLVSGGTLVVQDAQLEQSLVATEYIESGATKGKAGILEHSPRFDYSGGASCPSLLLEPSRTNSFNYSEYFGGLTKLNATLETNNTTSPEGLQNASRFLSAENDTLSKYIDFQGSAPPSTENQVFSLFVKNYNHRYIQLINNGDADLYANFDIANGIIGNYGSGTTASIEDYGNGWYRCTIVCDGSQNNINSACRIYLVDSLTQGYANQTNVALGNGVYIWGAMQENNASYPTSYIPNHSGGSVTREADFCEGAGTSSTFNDAEGVLYAEIAALADDGTNKYISINNGGTDDYLFLRYRSDNRFQVRYRSNNTDSLNETFDLSNNLDFNKIAVSYKRNEFKIFVNGSQIGSTDTSGTIFNVSVDNLDFESFNGGSNFYGKVKQVIVFNTALSDVELIALTS